MYYCGIPIRSPPTKYILYIYIHTSLQPSRTVSVIRYPMHRNHKLNSIRAKMQNDNENEKVHDL